MPVAVKQAIAQAVHQYGGFDEEGSKAYVNNLLKEGRIMEECWS